MAAPHRVDVQLVGAAGRLVRERELHAVWAYELRHAMRLAVEIGERIEPMSPTSSRGPRPELAP